MAKIFEKKNKTLLKNIFRHKELYLMFLPVALYYLVFSYFPMYGITLAFKDYSISKGIMSSDWVGLEHFRALFTTPKFKTVFKNTLVISFLKLIFIFPVPILLAIFLDQLIFKKYKTILQTAMYLPYFITWVIMASIIIRMLSVNGGLINDIAKFFGKKPINFMIQSKYFYTILILAEIWKGAGWGTIIYSAAIQGINPELYEAATIDGAGRYRQMTHITLPSISTTIVIMFILAVGNVMNAGFDPIFNLYNAAVLDKADIIDTYVYRIGMTQGLFEMATAVGLFKSIINFALLLFANFMTKRITGEGLYA